MKSLFSLSFLILKCQINRGPKYSGGPSKQGSENIPKFNKKGIIINGGLESYKAVEKQKQVVIKHATKMHTRACYFALKTRHE